MDVAFDLTFLTACKLIVYSFGALVHLFLMVLILGQRRLGRLEWLLFALVSALFMWNSGNLLALNVALAYGMGPTPLARTARLIPLVGFLASVPLLVHVHAEYVLRLLPRNAAQRRVTPQKLLVAGFYLPLAAAPWVLGKMLTRPAVDPASSLQAFVKPLVAWIVLALLVSAGLNFGLRRATPHPPIARLHSRVAGIECALAGALAWSYLLHTPPGLGSYFPTLLVAVSLVPSILLGHAVLRHNFLGLRVERNLIYSVVALFALLIYINFIRRLSGYLDNRQVLPAAVTEAVMIFTMVVFLEPVKKRIDRVLQAAFQSEFGRVQRLATEIHNYAKQTGDLDALEQFVEERVPAELGLKCARLELKRLRWTSPSLPEPVTRLHIFPIRRGEEVIGMLEVVPLQAELSGDYQAALQLLADQLASATELCQLIADKVQLERTLAEKAKLAFLGEMAARIAHNVKNPLSSMKTLVQLLEEDKSLPERARRDCRLVVEEIDRLNTNISQVLRYAKPARDTDRPVDLAVLVNRVVTLTHAEADRQDVKLEFVPPADPAMVEGGEEAATDIVSNLVVNALEASRSGSRVRITIRNSDGAGVDTRNREASRGSSSKANPGQRELIVEDQGPGVERGLKAKIFQPFFTTRSGGTGLGLAIVARRVEEIGGSVECQSPLENGTGTRFIVRFQTAGVLSSEETDNAHDSHRR